jgi:hypothetical protein
MRQMFSGLTITRPSNIPLTATTRTGSYSSPAPSSAMTSDPTARTAPHTGIIRRFEGKVWEASKIAQSWGLHGEVLKSSTKGEYTDYDLDFQLYLPLAWLFGSYALRGQLSIRKTSLVSNSFTLRHPSYFTVARILDWSHPFLAACRSNDITVVRTMLSNGEGRPTDMDAKGHTCLWVGHDCSVAPRFTVLTLI